LSSSTLTRPQLAGGASVFAFERLRSDWPLPALLALAAAIRFATLTHQSLWYDEAVTALRVLHPSLAATWHAVLHVENTPPLYYLLEWIWTRVFGTSVFALRSVSALAGVATVWVGWAIGREIGSRATAIVLAAIIACNPLFVWYSQEARAYELFVLLAALAFLFFLRARSRPTRRNLIAWGGWSILALATHWFAAFLIAPEAALLLLARPRRREKAIAIAAIAAAAGALAPIAIAQGGHGTGWITSWPLSGRLQAVGYYYLLGESGHPLGQLAEWAVLVPILAALALALMRDRGAALAPAIPAAVVGLTAILVPVVLALAGADYLAPRYLVAAWVPLSAALALAVSIQRPPLAAALALLICGAFLTVDAAVVERPQLQRGNWHWAADQLGGAGAERAVVIQTLGGLPLQYYLRGLSSQWPPARKLRVREIDLVGYEPLRRGATRPPAHSFVLARRARSHGLVVLSFRAPRTQRVSVGRLLARRPAQAPTEVLASVSAVGGT
jgi:mannosyltransferase